MKKKPTKKKTKKVQKKTAVKVQKLRPLKHQEPEQQVEQPQRTILGGRFTVNELGGVTATSLAKPSDPFLSRVTSVHK